MKNKKEKKENKFTPEEIKLRNKFIIKGLLVILAFGSIIAAIVAVVILV